MILKTINLNIVKKGEKENILDFRCSREFFEFKGEKWEKEKKVYLVKMRTDSLPW